MKLQTKIKKKIPKRIIVLTAILVVILTLVTVYTIFTDIIILRKTEDMTGLENAVAILFQTRGSLNDTEGLLDEIQILCDATRESGAILVLYNAAWGTA